MSFQGFLKQSTAVDVVLGPFVDSTDGDSEEVSLTIAQADVRLSKNGQTAAQKSDVTTCAHDADGFYNCELDATDTGTCGQLTIWVHVAGALAVRMDYHVVEEAVYDAMYGTSAAGPLQSTTAARTLDVTATGAAGIDWNNVENQNAVVDLSATDFQLVDTVTTCTTTTTNTDMLTAAAVKAEVDTALSDIGLDHLISASVTGTDVADDSIIASMVSKSVTADWDSYDNTSHSLENAYTNIGLSGNSLTSLPWNLAWDAEVESECNDALVGFWTSPATLVDLIWDEDVDTSHQTAGTAGKKLDDAGAAADPWATALPGAYGAGTAGFIIGTNLDAVLTARTLAAASYFDPAADAVATVTTLTNLPTITSNWLTAAGLATDAVNEIVDQVWLETLADHSASSGSMAEALAAAGGAGDPWITPLPGAYGAGTAGFIMGTNLDAVLTARTLAAASYFDPAADTVATVTTLTNLPAITTNWLTADGLATDAVAEIADQVWEEANGDHASGSTFGGIVGQTYTTTGTINVNVGTAGAGLTDLAGITNISSLVVSAGGAVDSMVQGFLNNTIAETSPDNISANFETFLDNADALTSQTVDDVGGLSAAEVLTQVNAALDTAISELGVAQPTATPSIRTGIMLMYMALRNQLKTQTSGTDALELYNDAGTMIAKKLLTDDGSDYTEAKATSG